MKKSGLSIIIIVNLFVFSGEKNVRKTHTAVQPVRL